MYKDRQSNMELLRIICMVYILIHHVLTGALPLSNYANLTSGFELLSTKILDAFCFVAVNVFILISGYFSIRPTWKNFLNLYGMCAFYVAILYFAKLYYDGNLHLGKSCLLYILFPFGRDCGWWFVSCYIILYLLSPLINRFVEHTNKVEFIVSFIFLTIVNLYFSFYRQSIYCNTEGFPTGYTVLQFVYMYFIGRYLRIYGLSFSTKKLVWGNLISYIVLSVVIGLIDYGCVFGILPHHPLTTISGYNHPFVILSSIAFFLLATTWNVKSSFINYLAQSCLPLFLLHSNCYFGGEIYEKIANVYNSTPPYVFAILITASLIIYALTVLAIDQVRLWTVKPMANMVGNWLDDKTKSIVEKYDHH